MRIPLMPCGVSTPCPSAEEEALDVDPVVVAVELSGYSLCGMRGKCSPSASLARALLAATYVPGVARRGPRRPPPMI
ncbi:MAG: hypothetical protein DMD82_15740 [Candidatus Rokuibacteriota bacterium]|nr:MAG: hypothetical protein DMD82_15740 [Candidatus Rokubacteria bacterium]